MAIIWRFVGRSTVLATLLLLLLLGMELHSAIILNTWMPPIICSGIVAYLLYFIHVQANSNRTLQLKLSTWSGELKHNFINQLTVIMGSLELMDDSEKRRVTALEAARKMHRSLVSATLENHGDGL